MFNQDMSLGFMIGSTRMVMVIKRRVLSKLAGPVSSRGQDGAQAWGGWERGALGSSTVGPESYLVNQKCRSNVESCKIIHILTFLF